MPTQARIRTTRPKAVRTVTSNLGLAIESAMTFSIVSISAMPWCGATE
jgi:hypothetical protein